MNTPSDAPIAEALSLPVSPYEVKGYVFGQRVRSRIILWARHLGDDILLEPGTPVKAIGKGKVIWAEVRPGSDERRNWGGIVVVAHRHKETDELFYSVYGHMKDLAVAKGDFVEGGQTVGFIAAGLTPENGWWKLPHLHFGIFIGPWMGTVLPGYIRPFDNRTKFHWWRDPRTFITQYGSLADTVASAHT